MPTEEFIATAPPADPSRLRWVHRCEVLLYTRLQRSGSILPPLGETPHVGPLAARNETALLELLIRKGAFEAHAGSARDEWQRGASVRAIWAVLREEGFVYSCFSDHRPRRGWHGWIGMKVDELRFTSSG